MSDKVIYFNTNTEKIIGAYGGAQLLNKYSIAYKASPVWEIHFVTVDEEGEYIPTDVSKATTWRAAIDIDFKSSTAPMVRTLPEGIDNTQASNGILLVQLDTDTETFLEKVDGKKSTAGVFEIRGTSVEGKVVFTYRFDITCYGAVDPYGTAPLPVVDGAVTTDFIYALLRAGRELQFSVDGTEWHDEQDIENDHYYRQRYPQGEWSEAIWFKDQPVPYTKIQYSVNGVDFSETAQSDSKYIKFSTDGGETWSEVIYIPHGKDGVGFMFKGQYNANTTYNPPTDDNAFYDIVSYKGSSWLFYGNESTSGYAPPETADTTYNDKWLLVASKGMDGYIGKDGVGFRYTGVYSPEVMYPPVSAFNQYYVVQYYGSTWVWDSTITGLNIAPPSSANEESDYWSLMVAGAGSVVEVYPENVIGLQQYITNITYPKQYINQTYYTSAYVQARLNEKANTSNVYVKTEVDNLINVKANTSDVYTKVQVDNKISNLGQTSLVPLSTYNTDMNMISNSLTNLQEDLDSKLSKTVLYNMGQITSEITVDGKRGDYQVCSLAEGSTATIGQTSFFNFDIGDGIVLEINKPYTDGVLSIEGKIILDSSTSGTFLIGVFKNETKYIITAPTEIIN